MSPDIFQAFEHEEQVTKFSRASSSQNDLGNDVPDDAIIPECNSRINVTLVRWLLKNATS